MPSWNRQSLQNHFRKRMSNDSACLQDVLGQPAPSITEDNYERASVRVLTTAWICFSGEAQDIQSSRRGAITYFSPANHFVDDRLLTTIVSRSTDQILTCYHEDFSRAHKPGKRRLEGMVRYVEHLGNQRRGNMLRNFSVERFSPPPSARVTLEAELKKVRAIPEKPAPVA